MKSNVAIIVVAYNRTNSLERLLKSLNKANYENNSIELIISIDKSETHAVLELSKKFNWEHGKKTIIQKDSRLGLKKHILECGDISNNYDYIIVLEDDLIVSPGFFIYAEQTIKKYITNKNIAGISLYSHQWNQYVDEPFTTIESPFDIYILQVASSWGQIWWKDSWNNFRSWIDIKSDNELYSENFPDESANWSSKSWLKFHNKYLVDSNSYFIYPKQSLTTNFSDPGEHANGTNTYQVALLSAPRNNYALPNNLEDLDVYDAFYENTSLFKYLKLNQDEVDISLYGNKKSTRRFLLTRKILDFKIKESFGIKLRPIEENIKMNIPGNEIFLYDTKQEAKHPRGKTNPDLNYFLYCIKTSNKKMLLVAALHLYANSAKRYIKNKFATRK